MKLKTGYLAVVLLFAFQFAQGQAYQRDAQESEVDRGFKKENLFFGGNLGLSVGSITYINVSPLVGYRFSDWVSAGVQVNAMYESAKYKSITGQVVEKDRYGLLGLGVFGRVHPIEQLFIHVQPELNYAIGKSIDYTTSPKTSSVYRGTAPAFLVGGGLSQSIGGRSVFVLMVLYDVLQHDRSPYGNKAIIRAGVNIGF